MSLLYSAAIRACVSYSSPWLLALRPPSYAILFKTNGDDWACSARIKSARYRQWALHGAKELARSCCTCVVTVIISSKAVHVLQWTVSVPDYAMAVETSTHRVLTEFWNRDSSRSWETPNWARQNSAHVEYMGGKILVHNSFISTTCGQVYDELPTKEFLMRF